MNAKTFLTISLPAVLLIGLVSVCLPPVQVQSATSTATYDPFAEPPLPKRPTQLELGRHTFWHHCMPCHGDAGQGLTDEFRLKWEPDHQNCWARGCHSGRYADDSFPVPTIVPALTGSGLLARTTPASLFEYLRATHPPEDPGLLSDEEYRALVVFLYDLNDAPLPAENANATPTPPPTVTPIASPASSSKLLPSNQADSPSELWFLLVSIFILTILLFARRARHG